MSLTITLEIKPAASAPRTGEPMLQWWDHLKRPVVGWRTCGGRYAGRAWTFSSCRGEPSVTVVGHEPLAWAELPVRLTPEQLALINET